MSINTVRKYVQLLEKKRLVFTEGTTICTREGQARNGNLKYTIRPIRDAIEYYDEIQMKRLNEQAARTKLEAALKKYDNKS